MSEPAETPTPAERAAEAALAVPGVAHLHAGSFGEVGTYLPGRRVTGIRIRDEISEVHVVATMGVPLRELADAVRDAVAPILDTPVQVVVEDVVPSPGVGTAGDPAPGDGAA